MCVSPRFVVWVLPPPPLQWAGAEPYDTAPDLDLYQFHGVLQDTYKSYRYLHIMLLSRRISIVTSSYK